MNWITYFETTKIIEVISLFALCLGLLSNRLLEPFLYYQPSIKKSSILKHTSYGPTKRLISYKSKNLFTANTILVVEASSRNLGGN